MFDQQEDRALSNPYFYYLGESLRHLETFKDLGDHDCSREVPLICHMSPVSCKLQDLICFDDCKETSDRLEHLRETTDLIVAELQQVQRMFQQIKKNSMEGGVDVFPTDLA